MSGGGRSAHYNAPPETPVDFFDGAACLTELAHLEACARTDIMCADSGPDAKTALAICSRCPIEIECLEWALSVGQESCTHGRIRFSSRFLSRYRTTMGRFAREGYGKGTMVEIRTTKQTAYGPPGTDVRVSVPVAAAHLANKSAEMLEINTDDEFGFEAFMPVEALA